MDDAHWSVCLQVVCVPYATHFDNQRLADEIQRKALECLSLLSEEVATLPVYAMGHGMGSLLQLLVLSKHRAQRDGCILLSYYNRPAADVIPFLSPMVAPGLKGMGGALSQVAASPLRSAIDAGAHQAKRWSPTVVQMILPLFEQVQPVVMVSTETAAALCSLFVCSHAINKTSATGNTKIWVHTSHTPAQVINDYFQSHAGVGCGARTK